MYGKIDGVTNFFEEDELMKRSKKILILLVVAIVLAGILEVIQVATSPAGKVYVPSAEMKETETDLFPGHEFDVFYDVTEKGLVPLKGDPWMQLTSGGAGGFRCVSFYFSRPTEEVTYIQVYYPDEGEYNERHTVSTQCSEGATYWAVEIPEGEYPEIRVDMDGTMIPLESIAVGNILPEAREEKATARPRRILLTALVLFGALCWLNWVKAWNRLKATVGHAFGAAKAEGRKTVIRAVCFPVSAGAAVLLAKGLTAMAGAGFTAATAVFAAVVGLFMASLLIFRKTLEEQPEYLFLILMLCVGFLFCWFVPHTGLNGWDEDVHYRAALNASYVDEVRLTKQDEETLRRAVEPSYDLSGVGLRKERETQNKLYQEASAHYSSMLSPWKIPEAFNGAGLFFGRALGLPYYMIHFLGRFCGLIAYAIAGFFAIRLLKSGKMLTAVILLIPTAVFIASSFNYDCYLTAFTALGMCYYAAEWQEREKKLTLQHAIIMIGSFFFGCLTKPVYIPLMWILLLLPKEKFGTAKQRKQFIWAIIGLTVLAGAIMLLTRVESSLTDSRGGGANGKGQLKYILLHPFEYLGLMWRFVWNEYLNPAKAREMLTNLAYHGYGPNEYVFLGLMLVTAFTDKNEYDLKMAHRPWVHILPVVISAGVMVAVISSMYVSFTPVGARYIDGAQFRYMIPVILPVLMSLSSALVQNKMNRAWYNGLIFAVAAFVDFAVVYKGFVCKYF